MKISKAFLRIAFFELEEWEKKYFESQLGGEFELLFFDQPINNVSDSLQDVEIIGIFIYSQINSEVLDQLPKLKLIVTLSTGVDHIDLDECKKRNIIVSNVPVYGEHTVAEHTFALILAISRRIIESYERIKDGHFLPEGLTGFDLFGKTIGVIGVGNIGKNVVKIAKGFGMKVLGFKRTPDPALEKELEFTSVPLEKLLSESDIVTLHIPYTQETHHFINEEKFEMMKDGVIFINTARGAIVATKALLAALKSGKVRAAGLDVLEQEPLLREEKELLSYEFKKEELLGLLEQHLLLSFPNVVITPHNAFNSKEALEKIVKTAEENIRAYVQGSSQNVV